MYKLPYSCSHFTCQQANIQNPSSQTSGVCELRTSRCISWIQKWQRNWRSNRQHSMYHRKSKGIPPPKKSISASLTTLKSLTLLITTICGKFLKRWAYQTTYHTCLQRNQYADKEATVRTKHGTTDWFLIGKGVCQGCNHPTYLTYMQSTSLKCRNHKLESRFLGEISTTTNMLMILLQQQKMRKNKRAS